MEQEKGSFTFDDVADGICKKLVVRHPHVFGDVTADDAGQVLKNWDAIKRETKGGKTQADMLRAVPRALPALMRAGKVQNRARRVGFDWPDVSGAMQALDSETMELKQAVASGDTAAMEEELGICCFRQSTFPGSSISMPSRRLPARRISSSAASPWSSSLLPSAGWTWLPLRSRISIDCGMRPNGILPHENDPRLAGASNLPMRGITRW